MSFFSKQSCVFCERAHCSVSLEQTEGQCRDRHNCSSDACPLEAEFLGDRTGPTLELVGFSLAPGKSGRER